MSDLICLFVYGTLRRGSPSHHLLAGQTFVQEALTEPFYRLLHCGGYPGLVSAPEGGCAIQGEIYRIAAQTLSLLDQYEEAPALYQRHAVRVQNFTEPVQAYFFQGDVTGLRDCGTSWPIAE